MIPRISNLILTITVRINRASCSHERKRAPDRVEAGEAGILKTVSLAGRYVAA